MKILVFNVGSSSLKFGVFDPALDDSRLFKGEFENFHANGSVLHYRYGGEHGVEKNRNEAAPDLRAAIAKVQAILDEFGYANFQAVGHRVVHGGTQFRGPTLINAEVINRISDCAALAPLHNPLALLGINKSRELWPSLPQVAVFDTAFIRVFLIIHTHMRFPDSGESMVCVATGSKARRITMLHYVLRMP